jgi:DeoR/GlpR family transcriptional regulator of sugar metabolism
VKQKMLTKAREAVVVADSSKIGQVAFACVAPLTDANLLITDAGIVSDDLAALEEAGLQVLVAE